MLSLQSLLCLLLPLTVASHSFGCCGSHETESDCLSDAAFACQWLLDADPLMHETLTIGDFSPKCVSQQLYSCAMDEECIYTPSLTEGDICGMPACDQADKQYNIQFIIDESTSVAQSLTWDFVEDMISSNVADNARVSVLAYGRDSKSAWVYKFGNDQTQRRDVIASLHSANDVFLPSAGSTCTGDGISHGLDDFKSSSAVTSSSHNIMFLITDGYPTLQCTRSLCAQKEALDAEGVTLYVLGVGMLFYGGDMSCVVDDRDSQVQWITDFGDANFYRAESVWRETVCPADVGVIEAYEAKRLFGYVPQWMAVAGKKNHLLLMASLVILAAVSVLVVCVRLSGRCCVCSNKEAQYTQIPDTHIVV